MYTRREFGTVTLGAFATVRLDAAGAFAGIDPKVAGVTLGAQTYSFRELARTPGGDAIDPVIKACVECGIGEVELFAPQVEPVFNAGERGRRGEPPSPEAVKAREALRKWRLETPLDHFRDVRKKFDAAGITIYAYNYSPNASFTEAVVDAFVLFALPDGHRDAELQCT